MTETEANPDHDRRRLSFGQRAADYDRLRPGLPAEVLDELIPAGVRVAAELGAGTGVFTRRLVTRVPTVYAVEPDARMRPILASSCPEAMIVEGSAEEIPLGDSSVDAVFVADAWHWFDVPRAIPEIGRVLRPGGTLTVSWNLWDDGVAWMRPLMPISRTGHRPGHEPGRFTLPDPAPFAEPERRQIRWTSPMSRRAVVDWLGTYSSILSRPEPERAQTLDAAAHHLATHPAVAGLSVIEVPLVTVYWRTTAR